MSETNKDIAVAFYKAVTEGRVEDAFRLYAGSPYRQHNPQIEDGMEGLRKVVTWLTDARCEIKRVFADGDYVILHSHWHGLSDNPRGEAVDIFRLEGGKVLEALFLIELSKHDRGAVDRFMTEVVEIPEVRSAFLITGRYDFVVHVVARDMQHLKDLALDSFTNRPGVTRIETSIVYEARARHELPQLQELSRPRAPNV